MLFALPFCLFILYLVYLFLFKCFSKLNHDELLTEKVIRYTILWGAICAPLLSCISHYLLTSEFTIELKNSQQRAIADNVLIGPFYEEVFKGFAPYLGLFFLGKRSARSFFLLAVFSGLGFFFMETIIAFLAEAKNGSIRTLVHQLIMRGMVLSLLHPCSTAPTGFGLGLGLSSGSKVLTIIYSLCGFCMAYFLHFWNNGVALAINSGEKIDQSEFLTVHIIVLITIIFLTRSKKIN